MLNWYSSAPSPVGLYPAIHSNERTTGASDRHLRADGSRRVSLYAILGQGCLLAIVAFLAGCQTPIPPDDVSIANSRALLSKALESSSKFYTIRYRNNLRIVVSNLEMQDNQYCYVLLSQRDGTSFSDHWRNYDGDGSASDDQCVDYLGVVEVEARDARH